MTTISYKLPDFEGPLDLLLFLIRKNKLNICDIPIRELLEQYMQTIEQMQQQDLEVESSFLEMAARLVHMKSASLLPRQEDAEQLRRELEGELIEYQLCQRAARRLGGLHVGYDLFVRAPQPCQPDKTYRLRHQPEELYAAYLAAAGRGRRRLPPPVQAFSGIVERKIVSVYSKIISVLRTLRSGYRVRYDTLFESVGSKSEMVATFLAVLELLKGNRITLQGTPEDPYILLNEGHHNKEKRTAEDGN
ncbi:MAG: segregation/condensation protein A [Clostridia bacterium]|nr:segregation/condensation protein A [Clostridia bacterium]